MSLLPDVATMVSTTYNDIVLPLAPDFIEVVLIVGFGVAVVVGIVAFLRRNLTRVPKAVLGGGKRRSIRRRR